MLQDFDREVLARLPLAEGVLSLWQFVCDDEHLDVLVLCELLLSIASLLATQATMNHDDGLSPAQHGSNPFFKVVQRVAVFGEDDQFAPIALGIEHALVLQQRR